MSIINPTDQNLHQLAAQVGVTLRARNQMLTVAESCTGGWIGKVITDVAGSSGWFDRGFVTYSNTAKTELLGVRQSTLANHSAVSTETVTEMAIGALERSRAGIAIAVSGIAGPDGGSPGKPAGTVYLAWALCDRPIQTQVCHFTGDRETVRRQTVATALQGVLDAFAQES
ncbi:MAG TPA: nicotinamide-nucleotide amidase [Candidatus Competibacteraceae bacterium]|nr:nicotinamide-nucleotide amidase [Candidatus Competibacteraceae bacterium]MCP5132893.1 nicotinamide-nucleotide amidase [Gammaproteobacteria bacterium]HPF58274.1 nicotinamide-nucleotide amidase [Candidatus Competibacteraceae bacterium]HRY17989.1 nicotinamide-nucleotide amidase [Candidatus Competibacteraceae bacterium]